MTMDRVVNAWESTPAADAAPEVEADRHSTWGGTAIFAMRTGAFLVLAAVAILVLLPAAVAAQVALLG